MHYKKILSTLVISLFLFTACEKENIVDDVVEQNQDNNLNNEEGLELILFSFKTVGGVTVDVSCDNNLSKDALPAVIIEKLAAEYTDYELFKIKACIDEMGQEYFQVKLKKQGSKRVVLYYDVNGNPLEIIDEEEETEDKEDDELNLEDLPQAILDYLNEQYPDIFVIKAEKEKEGFEVKLEDGTKLTFDEAGNLLEVKKAGEYGNSHLSLEDLPATIVDYISANYPDTKIVKAEAEEGGFEIRLTKGIVLLFDGEGNFLEEKDKGGDEDHIAFEDLPQSILDYISANYPDKDFVKAEKEKNGYEIKLTGGIELYFDEEGNLIKEEIENEDEDHIAFEDLPQSILDYISANYPDKDFVKAEKEKNGYEIKLTGGIELYFDEEGNLIKEEIENEEEDHIAFEDLPQVILDYISANYPDKDFVKAEKEKNGYEIKLTGGIELYFDEEGNLIKEEVEDEDKNHVAIEDLPQAILDYIAENYPDKKIVKAELEEDKYMIRLNSNIKLLFDLEGNFLGKG